MQIETHDLENPSVKLFLDDGKEIEARLDEFGVTLIVEQDGEIIGNEFKFYNEMKPKAPREQINLFGSQNDQNNPSNR